MRKRGSFLAGTPCFSLPVALAVLAAALWAGPALGAETLAATHVDKKLGFSIKVPKDWDFVASGEGERYIVATFTGKQLLETTKMKDWTEFGSHRPMMRIIAFTPENVATAEGEETEEEILGRKVTFEYLHNPYRDFKEFTKRTISGFYFGEEQEAEVQKVPCTYLDIFWEENRPPLRRTACVYHLGDMDIAVFFDVMEEWFPKYESLCKSAFKSFKKVQREEVVEDLTKSPGGKAQTRDDFIREKTASLPEGWTHAVSKRHLLLSHTDKSYTEKIGKFADAIREKIEGDFKRSKAAEGEAQSAELPLIRICQSPAEYNAYIDTGGGFSYFNRKTREVVAYDGTREGYDIDWVYSRIGNGVLWQVLGDEFRFWLYPDDWYMYGMSFYYQCFKLKGSSCKFVKDAWYANELREGERKGECKPLKVLMDPAGKGVTSHYDYAKVGMLVCFLNSKEGNKKPWKDALPAYLQSFRRAYEELAGQVKEQDGKAGDGDEGESAPPPSLSDHLKTLKQRAFDAVFGSWGDEDWAKLEAAWREWVL